MPEISLMEKNSDSREKDIPTSLELLAPAGNLSIGLEALSAGADAVYIGAPRFGARSAAGVPVADIATLADQAHLFGAKVYVALNTILYDKELRDAEKLVKEIHAAGADALIIQDFSLLAMDIPPIALHASTQCHNNDASTLRRLEALGFEQAVLARELTVEETATLSRSVSSLRLETFIHGALCVSYSGHCYLSQALKGRSANRGDCAQLCRLPYDLVDALGKRLYTNSYLLSLKDLNRSHLLPKLIEAGVTSFKIEGRLKSSSYVKNITAYYRLLLDEIIQADPQHYKRASLGRHNYRFRPNPFKSFSRGFTDYQIKRGNSQYEPPIRPESPKSEGEVLCRIQDVEGKKITLEKTMTMSNGDGVCFYTSEGTMQGGRVNKILGEKSFLYLGEHIPKAGSLLYRNYDHAFEEILSRSDAATRHLPIAFFLEASSEGLHLQISLTEVSTVSCETFLAAPLEPTRENLGKGKIEQSLQKLGNTCFECVTCQIESNGFFIPISLVTEIRRRGVDAMEARLKEIFQAHPKYRPTLISICNEVEIPEEIDFSGNVSNRLSKEFYHTLGAETIHPAFELQAQGGEALMTTKHCLRRYLGYCTLEKKPFPYKEPLYLIHGNTKLRLSFDCINCQMQLFCD